MNLGPALGRWQYLRGKSLFYIEALRSWVTPGAAAGAFAKYLGVSSKWSIIIAVLIPAVVETIGFFLGRFLYDRGGVFTEYQMALDRDPFKIQSLERLKAIEYLLADSLKKFEDIERRLLG